jgi:mRNA interferase RelE/StbE
MASYKIKWDSQAKKDLNKIDKKGAKAILKKVSGLGEDPLKGKPLKGEFKKYRRLRVGKYRVIYSVLKKIITVQILHVGSRGSVYKTN